ncbi:MAG: hypothetical protein ACJ77A_04290 [Actinomycetota bacterium]
MHFETTIETPEGKWARTEDGTWVRWEEAAQRWEEQPSGPWITPNPEALVDPPTARGAAAPKDGGSLVSAWSSAGDAGPLVDGPGGPPTPRSPLDDWWMRKFPPHSLARFLFFLVAIVPITALDALKDHLAGRRTPFIVYIVSAVGATAIVGVIFLGAQVSRRTGGAARTATSDSADAAEQASGPAIPVLAPTDLTRSVFDPGPGWGRDLLECLSIMIAAAIMFAAIAIGRAAFQGWGLVVIVVSALLAAIVISVRRSVLSVVIVAAVGGFAGAGLLEIFSAFWGAGGHFIESWLFCTAIAFVFLLPIWLALRRPDPVWGTGSAPGWAYATAAAVMTLVTALLVRATA